MNWIKFARSADHVVVDARVNDLKKMLPLEAAFFTIEQIIKRYPPPYTLMLSGGIDSQVMLWCWMKSGVEFKTRSVMYNNDLNAHDLFELRKFSDQHVVAIEYYHLDLLNFLEEEYDTWAHRYRCSSPQICTHMKMCSDIEGTVIFSGNFASAGRLFIDDAIMGMARYASESSQLVIPFFFLETPELAYSMVPFTRQENHNGEGFADKIRAYQESWFPIIPQPVKYTGFEKVKELYDVTHQDLVTARSKLEFANKPSNRVFDLLLRYPYEKQFGHPAYTFKMNSVLP